MNKKRIWLILPTTLLPYIALCSLATIFFSTKLPLFESIMEHVFQNNGLLLITALLFFGLLAAVSSGICFFLSIRKGWDALSLAKTAVIIKLLQIPAYGLICVLGVLFSVTIFTFAFTIGLFLFNCLTLVLTGLLTVSATINAGRQHNFTLRESFWFVILQFVFCADVIAAIAFYFTLRKRIANRS